MANLKLGSLFDGSGGFPLGGILAGITPLWSSEIEPFAIRVTTKRMPFIKHYGNVCEINGGKIEPVDIITFGSPCQDLSVAGKRNGLEGSKSSLFYEAVRIIKEMREKTNGKYPRYIVWENVPGAFSSNKGKDFKAVLDALIGVKEEKAEVPMPEKGAWSYADCFMGDGWSVAYRVLDAQYWGVPQRRRRIYLVADFRGECAGEILFKSEGVSGYSKESFFAWQRTANSTRESTFNTKHSNLTGNDTDSMTVYENHSQDTRYKELKNIAPTVAATYGEGGNNQPFVVSKLWNGEDVVPTLTANNAGGNQRMPDKLNFNCVVEPYGISADTDNPAICVQGSMIGRKDKNGPNGNGLNEEKAFTLNTTDKHAVFAMTTGYFQQVEENKTPTILARDYKEPGAVIYAIDRETYNAGKNFDRSLGINTEGVNSTLKASGPSAVAYSFDQGASRDVGDLFIKEKAKTLTNGSCPGHHNGVIDKHYTVRRLTPTECARLQGFPDRWCRELGTENPTDEEVYFWHKVFETQRKIIGKGKMKTDKQIRSWLKNPHSDSAEYKLWGNGVALPCVFFVLAGIVWANDNIS